MKKKTVIIIVILAMLLFVGSVFAESSTVLTVYLQNPKTVDGYITPTEISIGKYYGKDLEEVKVEEGTIDVMGNIIKVTLPIEPENAKDYLIVATEESVTDEMGVMKKIDDFPDAKVTFLSLEDMALDNVIFVNRGTSTIESLFACGNAVITERQFFFSRGIDVILVRSGDFETIFIYDGNYGIYTSTDGEHEMLVEKVEDYLIELQMLAEAQNENNTEKAILYFPIPDGGGEGEKSIVFREKRDDGNLQALPLKYEFLDVVDGLVGISVNKEEFLEKCSGGAYLSIGDTTNLGSFGPAQLTSEELYAYAITIEETPENTIRSILLIDDGTDTNFSSVGTTDYNSPGTSLVMVAGETFKLKIYTTMEFYEETDISKLGEEVLGISQLEVGESKIMELPISGIDEQVVISVKKLESLH